MKKRYKQSPQQNLVRKLDIALSRLIRDRDKDLGCITCGRVAIPFDAGHFVRREKMSTRFNPLNLNGQCLKCNRFQGGNGAEYSYALGKKYNKRTADRLVVTSKQIKQWDTRELEQLISAAKHSYKAYTTLYNELMPF